MTEVPEYINGSDTICHYTRFLGFWEPNCNCCRVGVSKMAELLHLFAENGLKKIRLKRDWVLYQPGVPSRIQAVATSKVIPTRYPVARVRLSEARQANKKARAAGMHPNTPCWAFDVMNSRAASPKRRRPPGASLLAASRLAASMAVASPPRAAGTSESVSYTHLR